MQPWDSWIDDSTQQFGGAFRATVNPATGGLNTQQSPTMEQQLATRRIIDNDIRYGRPVSSQRMQAARKMGAI